MKKLFLLLPWVFLLLSCDGSNSPSPNGDYYTGGPGSETTNGIVALVDNSPAAFAGVALRRVNHVALTASQENSVIVPDVFADSNGRFVLDSIEDDCEYRITVVSGGSAFSRLLSAKEIASLDSVTLTPTGSVAGTVDVPKGDEFVWVGVYGMDMLVKSDENGVV